MDEDYDYFQMAVSNCKLAEAHLEEAERSLRTLRLRLENSLKLINEISLSGPPLWENPSIYDRGRKVNGISRLPLYSS